MVFQGAKSPKSSMTGILCLVGLALTLTLYTVAFADDEQAPYHLHALDQNVKLEGFADPNAKTVLHPFDERAPGDWQIPLPGQVDAAIREAGLSENLGSADRMDRDLLYARARDFTIDQLKAIYPKLPEDKIQALKSAARNPAGKNEP